MTLISLSRLAFLTRIFFLHLMWMCFSKFTDAFAFLEEVLFFFMTFLNSWFNYFSFRIVAKLTILVEMKVDGFDMKLFLKKLYCAFTSLPVNALNCSGTNCSTCKFAVQKFNFKM